jgi:hypothetical protein
VAVRRILGLSVFAGAAVIFVSVFLPWARIGAGFEDVHVEYHLDALQLHSAYGAHASPLDGVTILLAALALAGVGVVLVSSRSRRLASRSIAVGMVALIVVAMAATFAPYPPTFANGPAAYEFVTKGIGPYLCLTGTAVCAMAFVGAILNAHATRVAHRASLAVPPG